MPFRIYVLVLSGLVGLSGAVEECQFWRGLAQNLSQARQELGKMAAISCNSSCSSIDCTIQMQTGFGSSGNLMFCFGLQLNSCEDPLSMSYYLDVPTVNITMSGKITHDDEYSVPVPDNLAISNAVKTTAIIKVEMVKVNTTHLKFGVNGILKMSVDFPLVPAFTKSEPVIPPTIIDIEPCRKNGSDTAPSIKIPRKCVSLPPALSGTGSTPTTAKIVVNSRTFNKSCEFGLLDGTQCSQNEMCAYLGSVSKNAACQCRPLHFLSATTGFCESLMSLTTAKVSDIPNATQAMSKSDGNSVDTKTGMIIGGGVGGLLLIVAVVVFIIIIGRQRRRAMYRNRHALMNDDDDDSLDTNVVI